MSASFELTNLPSPSAFSPLSPRAKSKPDLSITTSFPEGASSKDAASIEGNGQLERNEQRRRSSRGRKIREQDTNILMGLISPSTKSKTKNRNGDKYTRIPSSEESDFTTPTTLNSIDTEADEEDDDTPSSESRFGDHGRLRNRYQKQVRRFRLRLLYMVIPVVGIALLGLYTFLIVEHAQRNLLKKIQYQPQAQAQAQVAGGGQGVLATPPITEEATGTLELPDGLGPLKTGTDGAELNIGGGGGNSGLVLGSTSDDGIKGTKPPNWKGVEVPDRGSSGPTILVPTGVTITITEETPAPAPPPIPQLPKPPNTVPGKSIPANSITIPNHPYPLSCGPDVATAKSQNCIFDIMSYAWLPPPCYDHNLTTQFMELKSNSISLTTSKTKGGAKTGSTLSTGWRYYKNYSDQTPLEPAVVESGEVPAVYVTWEWHREHCLFMWRKLHRSLLVYGGGGDILGDPSGFVEAGGMETTSNDGLGGGRGREMMIDGYVGDYGHTIKCGDSLRGGMGIDLDEVNTMIRMKFPTCGVLVGEKKG